MSFSDPCYPCYQWVKLPADMNANRRMVCWQGWKLFIPRRWDPVKLEGDYAEGYALFADTLRPRLGLRWQTSKKIKSDPTEATRSALKNEVGQLAANEAKPLASDESWSSPLLYIELQVPGRDVYSVFSNTSDRLLQVAYHAHRRENILASSILPTLADVALDRAASWSIFDLNCVIPGGMTLRSQRLNAGDLGLTFADKFNQVTVRQIAVADLALKRQSLDGWIIDQQKSSRRYHRPGGLFVDVNLTIAQRQLVGRMSQMQRRRRYTFMWGEAPNLTTIALHDSLRDRLVLLHGSDESLLREIARTVGTL